MKPLLRFAVTLTCLLLIHDVLAQSESVPKFKSLVAHAIELTHSAKPVYFNKYEKLWFTCRYKIEDVNYDIKKTDSLINPIIGTVDFVLYTEHGPLLPTKEEAKASNSFSLVGAADRAIISLEYHYNNGTWRLRGGDLKYGNGGFLFKGKPK